MKQIMFEQRFQDDLYAHTWDTNFGPSPFDTDLEKCTQQEDTVDYEPTYQPEIYHPPAHNNFENSGWIPAEKPAVNNEEPQITGKNPLQKMKVISPYQKLQEFQKIHKISLPKIPQKLPKTTQILMHKKQN